MPRPSPPCALLAAAALAACAPASSPLPAPSPPPPALAAAGPGAVEAGKFYTFAGRPRVVELAREGDPQGAVALAAVGLGEPAAQVALAALLEARLKSRGFAASGGGDRDGLRVTVLGGEQGVEAATRALIEAALAPVSEGEEPAREAAARAALLARRPLDAAALGAFAACAGDPAPAPGEAPGDASPRAIEAARRRLGSSNSVVGFAGPSAAVARGPAAVAEGPAWPEGEALAAPGAAEGGPEVYAEGGRKRGTARVSVALWLPDPGAGPQAAERLGQRGSAVAGRLRALRGSIELRRVVGVARRGGSCVAASAEASGLDPATLDEEMAAAAATLRQELLAEAEGGAEAAARLASLGDPREAAAAFAWWSLASKGSGGPVVRVALGVAREAGSPQREPPEPSGKRFAAAYEAARAGSQRLEVKASQEQGQGQLRLLLASACPVIEAPGEHGTTAVALLATAGRAQLEGVELSPWLSPSGAGVVAQARPRPGEGPEALASRAAGAAARLLLGEPPAVDRVQEAQRALLSRLGPEPAPPPQLWSSLAPDQPSRFFADGSPDGIARTSVEGARLRWARLASGPLRLAVLATAGPAQVDAASKAVQRWMPPWGRAPGCADAPPGAAAAGGALPGGSRAYLAFRVDASGRGAGAAAATALLLGGRGGALAPLLSGLGVEAQSYVAGQGAAAALVVELLGPQDALADASERARGALEQLAAQIDGDAGKKALARWAELAREGQLDPRQRLVDLWLGAASPAVPSAAEWKDWVKRQPLGARGVVLRPGR